MNQLVLSVAMDLQDIFIQFVGISFSWISVSLCCGLFQRFVHRPRNCSENTLVLILKAHEARQLGDYRPISLGNFSGKIIQRKSWPLV